MDKFVIQGGIPIAGEIAVSGAKNSALPALAACLLTGEKVILDRIPPVRDIATMERLLEYAGARVTVDGERVTVEAAELTRPEAPYDLVKTMRASSLVLGPLAARCGRVRVSVPGGCAIGARPINLHVAGLERLGAVTRKVLTAAAVIGRGFQAELLTAVVADAGEDAVLDALDEAVRAQLLEAGRQDEFGHARTGACERLCRALDGLLCPGIDLGPQVGAAQPDARR